MTTASATPRKASPTERAYFDDVEGWLTRALDVAIGVAGLADASATVSRMRFLIYPHPGGSLPAHVDLSLDQSAGYAGSENFGPISGSTKSIQFLL